MMGRDTTEVGTMTNRQAMELRLGRTGLSMRESILRGISRDLVNLLGQVIPFSARKNNYQPNPKLYS